MSVVYAAGLQTHARPWRAYTLLRVYACVVSGAAWSPWGWGVAAACVYASSLTRYPRVTTVGIRMALPTTEHVCTCHVTLPPRALADVLPSLPPAPLLPRCYAAAVPRCRSAAFCPAAKTNTCAWGPRGPHPRKVAWQRRRRRRRPEVRACPSSIVCCVRAHRRHVCVRPLSFSLTRLRTFPPCAQHCPPDLEAIWQDCQAALCDLWHRYCPPRRARPTYSILWL